MIGGGSCNSCLDRRPACRSEARSTMALLKARAAGREPHARGGWVFLFFVVRSSIGCGWDGSKKLAPGQEPKKEECDEGRF